MCRRLALHFQPLLLLDYRKPALLLCCLSHAGLQGILFMVLQLLFVPLLVRLRNYRAARSAHSSL